MFCRYCGVEIQENSNFCNKCGKSLIQSGVDCDLLKNKKGDSKILVIISGIIVLVVLIVIVLFNRLTGVSIVNKTVEAGSVFTTKDFVIAKSDSATVTINGEVNTSVLGDNKLSYTVENGLFKVTKEFSIRVVDTTAPVISGPNRISVISGQKFEPSSYYKVEDFEEDLENKIEIRTLINTDSEDDQEITLTVKDSSGNEGIRVITVKNLKLSKEEEVALSAINQFIADGKSKDKILSSVWVMKTYGAENGVDYYVEVADNVLYAIYFSGEVSEFTVSDCGGATMHKLMISAVHYNGETVSSLKLVN